jgi:flagellar hook assembly protein FlgD
VIYNMLGQEVRRLVDGRLSGGQHRLEWDGRDARGQRVAPGVYLYRMAGESQRSVKKMSVLR